MKLEYQLTKEHLLEYQSAMAFQDEKVQKKCFTLMLSIAIVVVGSILLLFRINLISMTAAILSVVVIGLFFPKLYWSTVLARIERMIKNTEMKFNVIQVELKEAIHILDQGKEYSLSYDQLVTIQHTKNNCILVYNYNGNRNSLLIPMEAIDNYQEFDQKIQEEMSHA